MFIGKESIVISRSFVAIPLGRTLLKIEEFRYTVKSIPLDLCTYTGDLKIRGRVILVLSRTANFFQQLTNLNQVDLEYGLTILSSNISY